MELTNIVKSSLEIVDASIKSYEERLGENRKIYGVNGFREINTLIISLPRRLGNTTLAVEVTKKYSGKLFIPTLALSECIKDLYKVESQPIYIDALRGCDLSGKIVIVDNYTILKQREYFYELTEELYAANGKFYVFVG